MKLTDISNNKAKEIIEGAPKEATHFSCIEGKTQYYKNETVISSLDEVFINVFRDIFQPSVFLLSDLENQMNIDKVETQTEHQEEKSVFSGEVEWKNGDKCVYKHQPDVTYMFVGMHPINKKSAICWNEKEGIAQIHIDFISKPETQQQRNDRERLEAAYELFCVCTESDGATPCSFDVFGNGTIGNSKKRFLAIVDKTNYRKGVK